ncbi:MAG: Unknown protein [uncultured Sulfurovum sp.]|uniref:Uncharacterized protein n=1 Tax=uncultured Sulfurovum sp. TaxID=269237 RepID=A0A6S6SQ28_9BACT|nr:MAG: Unknown protein [uncultured Sulfurovum sp.]
MMLAPSDDSLIGELLFIGSISLFITSSMILFVSFIYVCYTFIAITLILLGFGVYLKTRHSITAK